MMLMSQAFTRLLTTWELGKLPSLSTKLLKEDVLIALSQALTRTLQLQNSDRSWGDNHHCEETAYALILLTELRALPHFQSFRHAINSGPENARENLVESEKSLSAPEFLWIEKVTYGSSILSQSYILTALKRSSLPPNEPSSNIEGLVVLPTIKIAKFVKFYQQLPYLIMFHSGGLRVL